MTMKTPLLLAWTALLASATVADDVTVTDSVVLSKKVMTLALNAAKLSSMAYDEDPPGDPLVYDHFGFFDDEPDQAIVARQDGYCYVAFRGTTLTWVDWQQNLALGTKDICVETDDSKNATRHCCKSRQGFVEAFETSYRKDLEDSLRECAADCEKPDECVVLTGHSQGGAVAAVAGLVFADLNPFVYTFGQPPTIELPCNSVTPERWFRFVNTKSSEQLGILYDPVPFVPGLGAVVFGQFIVLGDDPTGVAYIGLNAQDMLSPLDTLGFEAHSMVHQTPTAPPGYVDRLEALMDPEKSITKTTVPAIDATGTNQTIFANPDNVTETKPSILSIYPIPTDGFVAGSFCSLNKECRSGLCDSDVDSIFSLRRCVGFQCEKDSDCDSNRCDSGLCVPKLGSCQVCDEDSDCKSEKCYLFHCAGLTTSTDANNKTVALMDDNCACQWPSDCVNHRCEWFTCQAKLAVGSKCTWGTDCKTGYCSWNFRCESTVGNAGFKTYERIKQHKVTKGLVWFIKIAAAILVVGGGVAYLIQAQQMNNVYESVPDADPEVSQSNGQGNA